MHCEGCGQKVESIWMTPTGHFCDRCASAPLTSHKLIGIRLG